MDKNTETSLKIFFLCSTEENHTGLKMEKEQQIKAPDTPEDSHIV